MKGCRLEPATWHFHLQAPFVPTGGCLSLYASSSQPCLNTAYISSPGPDGRPRKLLAQAGAGLPSIYVNALGLTASCCLTALVPTLCCCGGAPGGVPGPTSFTLATMWERVHPSSGFPVILGLACCLDRDDLDPCAVTQWPVLCHHSQSINIGPGLL